jgi:two-component system cell cycle sensor histidine kinase/response regulator CckA
MTTILLVDVADADAAILASALRVEGYEVVTAKTANDARQLLASRPMALTIIDLMLRGEGGGNGLELARELRRDHPGMRVLLTSSYHLSERQLERADCGVSGFIPKPYDVHEVVDFVRAKVSAPPSSRRLWCAEPPSGITPRSTLLEREPETLVIKDGVASSTRR